MKKFLKERELILITEKTKVIVFGRKGREKMEKWAWEGKEMKKVKTFKYLGFTFNKNGGYKEHIKELRAKGFWVSKKV